jgi:hypothetical protein
MARRGLVAQLAGVAALASLIAGASLAGRPEVWCAARLFRSPPAMRRWPATRPAWPRIPGGPLAALRIRVALF